MLSNKGNKYTLKALESIRSFINSNKSDVDDIIPNEYIQKLGQYDTKISTSTVIIEAYDAALRSYTMTPMMIDNLLTILLICYDNIVGNEKMLNMVANIYIDVLLTLIISSCKDDNVDINSLKLFTEIVSNNFINRFNGSYDFPLAHKLCPIYCPVIAVVKLLNRKQKHPKYVKFLEQVLRSNDENVDLNNKLRHSYKNANTLNEIPIMNTFNDLLLNNYNVQSGGAYGWKNQMNYKNTEFTDFSADIINKIAAQAIADGKVNLTEADLISGSYRPLLDAIQNSPNPFQYRGTSSVMFNVEMKDYKPKTVEKGLLKDLNVAITDFKTGKMKQAPSMSGSIGSAIAAIPGAQKTGSLIAKIPGAKATGNMLLSGAQKTGSFLGKMPGATLFEKLKDATFGSPGAPIPIPMTEAAKKHLANLTSVTGVGAGGVSNLVIELVKGMKNTDQSCEWTFEVLEQSLDLEKDGLKRSIMMMDLSVGQNKGSGTLADYEKGARKKIFDDLFNGKKAVPSVFAIGLRDVSLINGNKMIKNSDIEKLYKAAVITKQYNDAGVDADIPLEAYKIYAEISKNS